MKRISLASTRAKVIAVLAVVALVAGSVLVYARVREASLPAVEVTTVTRTRLTNSVVAVGDIEAGARNVISLLPSVKVVDVLVEEGQRVSAGDTLIVLDTSEFERQLVQQGITLDDARSTLDHLAGASSTMDRGTAAGAVSQAGVALDSARAQLDAARRNLADVPALTENALRQADVAVEAAVSRRDAAEQGVESVRRLNRNAVDQAEIAVDAAELAVDKAKRDLADLKRQLVTGVITQAVYDAQQPALRLALQAAESALSSAEVTLSTARVAADADEDQALQAVQDAENAIASAEASREAASLQGNTTLEAAEKAVTDAELAVRSAELGLADARRAATFAGQSSAERADNQSSQVSLVEATIAHLWDKVEEGRLRASVDGVVSRVDAEAGRYPQVGDLIVVEGSTGYVASVEVSQPDSVGIRPGQRVTVTLKGIGTVYEGSVTEVAPVAEVSTTSADTAPKVTVTASVLDPDDTIRVGFEADAEIHLDEKASALQVDPAAIVREPGTGRAYALVVGDDNRVARAWVRTGIEGDATIEVLDGLVEGQECIVDPDPTLRDGTEVRITRGAR